LQIPSGFFAVECVARSGKCSQSVLQTSSLFRTPHTTLGSPSLTRTK
jgi:hypothetical protein